MLSSVISKTLNQEIMSPLQVLETFWITHPKMAARDLHQEKVRA